MQPLPPSAVLGLPAGPPLPPGSVSSHATGRSRGRGAKAQPSATQPDSSSPLSTIGASTAMSAQTLAMAKFLGMNLQTDVQLMWIAQEALLAKLPEGCSACMCVSSARPTRCAGGRSSAATTARCFSTTEAAGAAAGSIPKTRTSNSCALRAPMHVFRTHFCFRYSKFSNMKKGGRFSNDGQNGKDRQMVDM